MTQFPASKVPLRPLADPEAGPASAPVIPADGETGLTSELQLCPDLQDYIARVRTVTDGATLLILLVAALVFLLAVPGASLP